MHKHHERKLGGLESLLRENGLTDFKLENAGNGHIRMRFSFGGQQGQVSLASTPSDVNWPYAVARQIRRELLRLGIQSFPSNAQIAKAMFFLSSAPERETAAGLLVVHLDNLRIDLNEFAYRLSSKLPQNGQNVEALIRNEMARVIAATESLREHVIDLHSSLRDIGEVPSNSAATNALPAMQHLEQLFGAIDNWADDIWAESLADSQESK
jgi:hypothetical protein